ncbi:hypothetical protein DV515_00004571 [Chloebia gouldiae]|uniref:protein-tyrosine-phosphatase n=1 Tax=Chloebia gouldiae TaxID=44316 RepID=A0A3L8SQA7_CHLGU|nr:hypothetical protein DV515_00004571 [Chloebia gouldiae]
MKPEFKLNLVVIMIYISGSVPWSAGRQTEICTLGPEEFWLKSALSFFLGRTQIAPSGCDEARGKNCGVLVHCLAGISRSVTVTVAYLMQKLNLSMNDAYDIVKMKKSNISPNFNFMGQLLDFERTLGLSSPCDNRVPNQQLYFTTPSNQNVFQVDSLQSTDKEMQLSLFLASAVKKQLPVQATKGYTVWNRLLQREGTWQLSGQDRGDRAAGPPVNPSSLSLWERHGGVAVNQVVLTENKTAQESKTHQVIFTIGKQETSERDYQGSKRTFGGLEEKKEVRRVVRFQLWQRTRDWYPNSLLPRLKVILKKNLQNKFILLVIEFIVWMRMRRIYCLDDEKPIHGKHSASFLNHNGSPSLPLEKKKQPRSVTRRSKSIPNFTLHRTCGLWDIEFGGGGVINSVLKQKQTQKSPLLGKDKGIREAKESNKLDDKIYFDSLILLTSSKSSPKNLLKIAMNARLLAFSKHERVKNDTLIQERVGDTAFSSSDSSQERRNANLSLVEPAVCQLPAQHRNSQRAGMDALLMQHVDCLFGELKRKQARNEAKKFLLRIGPNISFYKEKKCVEKYNLQILFIVFVLEEKVQTTALGLDTFSGPRVKEFLSSS